MKRIIFLILLILSISSCAETTKSFYVYNKFFFPKEELATKSAAEKVNLIPWEQLSGNQDVFVIYGESADGRVHEFVVPSYIYGSLEKGDRLLVTWKPSIMGGNFSYMKEGEPQW